MDQASRTALRRLVDEHSTFLHVTHVNPDADGFGSALAMHRWLVSQGKTSQVLVPSPVPRKIDFLAREGEVTVAQAGALPPHDDAVFMIYDVSTLGRLGELGPIVARSRHPVVVFDHHDGDVEFEAVACVEAQAGATAQVLFDVLTSWGVKVTADVAAPLYVGLVADTGSFNYGKTSRHTHEVAGLLLEAGVDPLKIHHQLTGNRSLQAVHAGGEVLTSLRIDEGEPRVAHATMTLAQYEDGGADALEMLDLVNQTIALQGVAAGVLFIEAEPSVTRLSFRSRGGTSIVEVAQQFGGGGHSNAAGATIHEPLAPVQQKVLRALRDSVRRQHGG